MRGELLDVDGGQRSSTSIGNGGIESKTILCELLTATSLADARQDKCGLELGAA